MDQENLPLKVGQNTDSVTDKRLANLRPPWKKGESGNPGGRPKGRWLTDELEKQLPPQAKTLVAKLLKRANKNPRDLDLVWTRSEGNVPKEPDNAPTIRVVIVSASVNPPTELKNATSLTDR